MQTNEIYCPNVVAHFFTVLFFIAVFVFAFAFVAFPTSSLKENKNEKKSSVKENPFRFPLSQPVPSATTKIQHNGSLEMKLVINALEHPQQISYHLPTNNLLLSLGQPNKLSSFSADNTRTEFFRAKN